jgi:hypothetical protein
MREMPASKWRRSLAPGFASRRELHFRIDTIPKPVGLGLRGPLGGLSVRQRSGVCPGFVRPVSGIGFGTY